MSSLPKPEENPEHRSYKYEGTENLVLLENALVNYNDWVVDKFIKSSGAVPGGAMRVLDFGSGLGTLSKIFYRKTGIRPDGLDIDLEHRAEMVKGGFKTYATLAELPELYDVIYTSNVLEHIDEDVEIMRNLRAHIKKDGLLLIYVPAFESLWTPMDDMIGHVRRYRIEDLSQKLRETGYSIASAEYCDSVGFVLSILFKYIGPKSGELPFRSLRIYDRFLLPVSKVMDFLFSRFFGKNVYIVAKKTGG